MQREHNECTGYNWYNGEILCLKKGKKKEKKEAEIQRIEVCIHILTSIVRLKTPIHLWNAHKLQSHPHYLV